MIAPLLGPRRPHSIRAVLSLVLAALLFSVPTRASVGDRSPEFQDCLQLCERENCAPGHSTPIPPLRRLLLWDCPSECDYTCQHIVTAARLAHGQPVVQFHGKWPFRRLLGIQEPFSVLFSAGNFLAHYQGLAKLRARVPASYPLRPFYELFSALGLASWIFSALFHTRDFPLTEQLDYFAAGASVLYGTYYAVVRVFRLADARDDPRRRSLLRAWSALCAACYLAHVAYLKLVAWDYTYNMAANVAAGLVHNAIWSWFSVVRYRASRRGWAAWPGLAVAWVMFAMSMELFDFPPWLGCIDAHSLWHLMTIGPTVLWYNFLVKDAIDDIARSERLKS